MTILTETEEMIMDMLHSIATSLYLLNLSKSQTKEQFYELVSDYFKELAS